jgi:tetratricopeptide (TPR) repeat protein
MESEDVKLLTEVGFLAAAAGDVRRAETIFRALELHRPHAAFPYAGRAVALMHAGQADQAVEALDAGLLQADPEGQVDLHALRGLALHLAGRASESRRALHAAGDHRLAHAMLGEATV